jgi:hypothetical protein
VLRPVDPGERFTREVMARLAEPPGQLHVPSPLRHSRAWMALAACALLVLSGALVWQVNRVHQGLQARAQLLEALRVTGRKLDVAYRAVNEIQPRIPQPSGV